MGISRIRTAGMEEATATIEEEENSRGWTFYLGYYFSKTAVGGVVSQMKGVIKTRRPAVLLLPPPAFRPPYFG